MVLVRYIFNTLRFLWRVVTIVTAGHGALHGAAGEYALFNPMSMCGCSDRGRPVPVIVDEKRRFVPRLFFGHGTRRCDAIAKKGGGPKAASMG